MARKSTSTPARPAFEGIVSKVRDSRYASGRSNDWVKKTRAQRETHPTAGFALKENKFDGVYVGRLKGNQLVYAGKVDHGFDPASTKELAAKAAHPQNATLHQEDSAPRRMGGTFALGGDRISGQISRRKGSASGIQRHQGGPAIMTVWLYVDTRYRVGHPDHIKAFADPEAAERSFKDNDAEGVAFEYEVIGR